MVDDDWLWGHQQCMQALRDLRELHPLSLKDLQKWNQSAVFDQSKLTKRDLFNGLNQTNGGKIINAFE